MRLGERSNLLTQADLLKNPKISPVLGVPLNLDEEKKTAFQVRSRLHRCNWR